MVILFGKSARQFYRFPDTPGLRTSFFGKIARLDSSDLDLLDGTRGLQCSDPRDKIYGLLSLLEESVECLLPNYDASVNEVFRALLGI